MRWAGAEGGLDREAHARGNLKRCGRGGGEGTRGADEGLCSNRGNAIQYKRESCCRKRIRTLSSTYARLAALAQPREQWSVAARRSYARGGGGWSRARSILFDAQRAAQREKRAIVKTLIDASARRGSLCCAHCTQAMMSSIAGLTYDHRMMRCTTAECCGKGSREESQRASRARSSASQRPVASLCSPQPRSSVCRAARLSPQL